jgi:uncharacterized membrane protein YbhN (UPF0104 family)
MEKVRHISAITSSSSFRSRLALCGVLVCRYVRVRMPATPVTSGVIVVYFSFLLFSFFLFFLFPFLSLLSRIKTSRLTYLLTITYLLTYLLTKKRKTEAKQNKEERKARARAK